MTKAEAKHSRQPGALRLVTKRAKGKEYQRRAVVELASTGEGATTFLVSHGAGAETPGATHGVCAR